MWLKVLNVFGKITSFILRKKDSVSITLPTESRKIDEIPNLIPTEKQKEIVQPVIPVEKQPEKKKTKEEELISVLSFAEGVGFDKWIPYVQAWHETARFTKVIGNFNYWGIKKPRGWTGKVYNLWTTEYVKKPVKMTDFGTEYEILREDSKGMWIKLPQPFIDFDSAKEAIVFWYSLLKRLSVYKQSWQRRHDYKKFFKFLTAWATDPTYGKKLIHLYRDLREKGKLS